MKRTISALLLLAALLSLAVPVGAFSDITDPATVREVAVLETMGVVNGMSATAFAPGKTLTRAQFCKMAVLLKGDGGLEPVYRSRTIFPDVRAGHWANGYINLAVSTAIGASEDGAGGVRLIRGLSDGTFRPDRAITFAEAVTILMRLLGYSDADAGMNWPQGFLTLAGRVGLTKGLELPANQSLTRAQAAHLFYSALFTPRKGGTAYYNALGAATAGVVLMDDNATADDGTAGALRTSAGVYKLASGKVGAGLVGCRGVLVADEDGKALAFLPRGEQESFVVRQAEAGDSGAQAGWITDQNGEKHRISSDTKVYTAKEATTYGKIWMSLYGGTPVTVFYNEAGRADCLYVSIGTEETASVAVAYRGGSDLQALVEGVSGYSVYRDGVSAAMSDVCKYDVGVYDPAARVLSVSSSRLTGRYDNAFPNPQSPSKLEMLGATLEVLERAADDLAAFKPGDSITALLTPDGKVAGVVAASELRETNVGILEAAGETARVKLLSGLEITGKCASTTAVAGELVRVYASDKGTIGISRISGGGAGELDVAARTLGKSPLAANCRFFDRLERSAPVEVKLEDLAVTTVRSSQVAYVHKTTGGSVDLVIFNNATGDAYHYGRVKIVTEQELGDIDDDGNMIYETKYTYQICNQVNPDGYGKSNTIISARRGDFMGIAYSADGKSILGTAQLTAQKNVRRSSFTTRGDQTFVAVGSRQILVSRNVQCYNAASERWFQDLDEIRAYSDNLTVYYDNSLNTSGQVRVIVAEKP